MDRAVIKAKGRSATEKGKGATITVMPLHYFLFFAYKGLISSQILCFPGGHVLQTQNSEAMIDMNKKYFKF